jgi:hypothetical protein
MLAGDANVLVSAAHPKSLAEQRASCAFAVRSWTDCVSAPGPTPADAVSCEALIDDWLAGWRIQPSRHELPSP